VNCDIIIQYKLISYTCSKLNYQFSQCAFRWFILCKYKPRKVTVYFYDEEIANKKNPLSQHSSKYDTLSNVKAALCRFSLCRCHSYDIWGFLQCLPRFYHPVLIWLIPLWWWQKDRRTHTHTHTYTHTHIHTHTHTIPKHPWLCSKAFLLRLGISQIIVNKLKTFMDIQYAKECANEP